MEIAAIEVLSFGMTAVYRPTLTKGETLAGLQGVVGGTVDCFDIAHPDTGSIATMWFHDEGKILGQTPNVIAMAVAIVGGWEGFNHGDFVAGNVALTGFDPESGETLALPPEWMEVIAAMA